ncbi:MAG: hydrolase [Bacillota bacterium]|nr:hydrolase [Bacillota bacterium]
MITIKYAELLIQNGDNIFAPIVEDGVTWDTSRSGEPGKLTFSVLKDSILDFTEGDAVRLRYGGDNIFYGFVFQKKRDKDGVIEVTAYDQLRYLKNKDTYVYSNKTAGEVIQMIADDFRLKTGELEDTGYKIPSRVEDNKTLFDIIQTALDETLRNTKRLFVMYDDFGKLTLKNIESMKLNLLIDEAAGENFSYTSSIDGETYNKIKLAYDNDKTGKREIYIAQDSENMNRWGVLQYFDTIKEEINGKAKADALLQLYNQKTRNLTISNVLGDTSVRAGSSVIVKMDVGDLTVANFMIVEKAKHTFSENEHLMDLTLRGGDFIA